MKPTVMVLGATGFLGAHVARAFGRRGYEVHATRRASSRVDHVRDVDLEWHRVDLDDKSGEIEEALEPCEAVVDCAGFSPRNAVDIDGAKRRGVGRLRRVLEASRGARIRRYVYVSSPATLYADRPDGELAGESDFYTPGSVENAYHEAKFSMEAEIYRYLAGGPPVVIAIPGALFGPGDVGPGAGQLLVQFAQGRLPVIIPGSFNAVDVRDVAESLVAMLEQGRPGRRYVLGGDNVEMRSFLEAASAFCDAEVPDRQIPVEAVRPVAETVERVARRFGYEGPSPLLAIDLIARALPLSSERSEAELGHDVRPLETTLRDAFDWFRDEGHIGAG